jgi:hypothetical protein
MRQIKFYPLKEEGMGKIQLRSVAFLLISLAFFFFTCRAHGASGSAVGGGSASEPGAASVDPATPGYKELGCGTDVFAEYASENNVKGRVLDIDAVNTQKYLVLNPSVQEGIIQRVSGTSVSEYASELGVTVGLKGSYMWFSASVKTAFTDNTYRMSEYSYVTLMERHYKNSLKIMNTKWDPAYLKSYLTIDANKAINNTDPQKVWSPKEIISTFGTHVMLGIFTGARLDYNLSIKVTETSHQRNLQAYAEAKAKTKLASASFSTGLDKKTSEAMSTYEQRENILAKGGNEQYARPGDDADYRLWKASIDSNPSLVGIIKDALVPIWEFAQDPARAAAIQNYYKEYALGKNSDFVPLMPLIITGIEVTEGIPSTQAGYLPLRDLKQDAANAYVNKGVSSIRTPTRQHDKIMEATKVWIAYKLEQSNQTKDSPVTSIHIFTGDPKTLDAHVRRYGPHSVAVTDFNTDTCETPYSWHTNPCPTKLCAYSCDNVKCNKANTHHRFLHFEKSAVRTPLKAVVLGDDVSKNTAVDFNTRKNHIWWGPQDINGDGKVDDADARLVLNGVVWMNDEKGKPVNLNEGAKNYYVYNYECPWGCCWVKTSITNAPAQYLGYVP